MISESVSFGLVLHLHYSAAFGVFWWNCIAVSEKSGFVSCIWEAFYEGGAWLPARVLAEHSVA